MYDTVDIINRSVLVCMTLYFVYHQSSIIHHPSTIIHLSSIMNHPSINIYHPSYIMNHPSINIPSYTIHHLWPFVRPVQFSVRHPEKGEAVCLKYLHPFAEFPAQPIMWALIAWEKPSAVLYNSIYSNWGWVVVNKLLQCFIAPSTMFGGHSFVIFFVWRGCMICLALGS